MGSSIADFGICAPCGSAGRRSVRPLLSSAQFDRGKRSRYPGLPAPQGQLSRRKNQSNSFPSAGRRPLRRDFKSPPSKLRANATRLSGFWSAPFSCRMRNSRSPKSGKAFTRDRSTDRDSFVLLGNTLPGTRERLTIAAGLLALMELQLGMACYSEFPRRGLSSRNRSSGSPRY